MSGGVARIRCRPLALIVNALLVTMGACGREPRGNRTGTTAGHSTAAGTTLTAGAAFRTRRFEISAERDHMHPVGIRLVV